MDSGYYAACTGLRAQNLALEVIANNLANTSTVGYRGGQEAFQSLIAAAPREQLSVMNNAINDFNVLGATGVDLSSGSLERSGNPLDLAIEGEGFFAVRTVSGTAYTRNGSFQISALGQITTQNGDPVLGATGPVTVPSGEVSVSADGTISVKGAVVDKLSIVHLTPGTVEAVGAGYYSAPPDQAALEMGARIRQGMLEGSNVEVTKAVADLIVVQRHAEMLQRALSVFYSEFNQIAANTLPKI